MEQKIIRTWGFKSDGSAEIFDLKEGESLPDGWADRPEPWHHPNSAHLYPELPENVIEAAESVLAEMTDKAPAQKKPRRRRPRKSEES